jgi:hypothetical protein
MNQPMVMGVFGQAAVCVASQESFVKVTTADAADCVGTLVPMENHPS